VGAPTISVSTAVDLSSLAGGVHELRVVAYQGDRIFTQGYSKVSVDTSGQQMGDVDGNGFVNLADFEILARCFGEPISEPPSICTLEQAAASDLNGDLVVNLRDFVVLARYFGEGL
jgi:hypothetical protein